MSLLSEENPLFFSQNEDILIGKIFFLRKLLCFYKDHLPIMKKDLDSRFSEMALFFD